MCKYLSRENYHGHNIFADKSIEVDRFATLDDVVDACDVRTGVIEEVDRKAKVELHRPHMKMVDAVSIVVRTDLGRETLYQEKKDFLKTIGACTYSGLIDREVSCYCMTGERSGVAEGRNIFMLEFDKGPYYRKR